MVAAENIIAIWFLINLICGIYFLAHEMIPTYLEDKAERKRMEQMHKEIEEYLRAHSDVS